METGLTEQQNELLEELNLRVKSSSGNSIEVQTTMTHSDYTEMENGTKSLPQTGSVQQQLCQSAMIHMKDEEVKCCS